MTMMMMTACGDRNIFVDIILISELVKILVYHSIIYCIIYIS